jgi:ferrous iron transport protein A
MAFDISAILHSLALGGAFDTMARKNRRIAIEGIDKHFGREHTEFKMQLSGNSSVLENLSGTLMDLRRGDVGILDAIDLPGDDARRLMELGFLPGTPVTAGFSAPGGDPRVFQVDGSEIALRRETAKRLTIKLNHRKPRP